MTTILKDAARSIAIDHAGDTTGVTFRREDGPIDSVTIRFGAPGGSGTREAAIALMKALSDQYGLGFEPPVKTFQEQYAELAPGEEFKIVWGGSEAVWERNVKLHDSLYFNFDVMNLTLDPRIQRRDATITKLGVAK